MRDWRLAVVLAVVGLGSLLSYTYARRDLPWTFMSGDEQTYADMGRRIATGRGFTTGVIFPIEEKWGVDQNHPSLLRSPMWPLVLSVPFRINGVSERAAHLMVFVCYLAACLLAAGIGHARAGPMAGVVTGLAVALAPDLRLYATFAGTETLLAALIALLILLLVREAHPVWVGAACAAAYLTRYNAGILLPAVMLAIFSRARDWRAPAICLGAFVFVCAPWWIRNALVTGDPFYTTYRIAFWISPIQQPFWLNQDLMHMIEPDLTAAPAMHPAEKFTILAPLALAQWPVAAANVMAFAGLLWGCLRRDRACLALGAALLATKVLLALVAIRSRYLVPFIPAALALGTAVLATRKPRFAAVALGLVLLAPLLPTIRNPDPHLLINHATVTALRQDAREGGTGYRSDRDAQRRLASCLKHRPLALARNAPAVVWPADTATVVMTRLEEDFWTLLREYPIEFVRRELPRDAAQRARFLREFTLRADCGSNVYQRLRSAVRPVPGTNRR